MTNDLSTAPEPPPPPSAWEPITPRGVAAFARASLNNLLFVQLLVAILAAVVVLWFLAHDWFPVIRDAIGRLPPQGEITGGKLKWSGDPAALLANNHFLGFAVDLNHNGALGHEAQVHVEFGRQDLRVFSPLGGGTLDGFWSGLVGYAPVDYPPVGRLPFNQTELLPKWGAWEPFLKAAAAVATVAGLMLSWWVLATLYFLPVRLISFLSNRDLNLRQSWRLAAAALLPGALFLTFAILCYSLDFIDLIRLGAMFILHFVIAWIYIGVTPFFLPKAPVVVAEKPNPFA